MAVPNQQADVEAAAVCAEPKLFIGGLRYDVAQENLRTHYSQYGVLRSVVLLTHHDTGKSKGCAMVLFENWADAEAVINTENGTVTQLSSPRTAVVKFADPQRNEHGVLCGVTPKKLFIGQVPPDVTQDQIRNVFQQYGNILDLNIMAPRKPGAMGCAFVTYGSWAESEAAMRAVDGKYTLPGSPHPVAVKFADAKPAELAKFEGRGTKRGAWEMGNPASLMSMMAGGGKRQFMGGMGRGDMGMNPMMMNPMMMNPMMMSMMSMNPMMMANMQNMMATMASSMGMGMGNAPGGGGPKPQQQQGGPGGPGSGGMMGGAGMMGGMGGGMPSSQGMPGGSQMGMLGGGQMGMQGSGGGPSGSAPQMGYDPSGGSGGMIGPAMPQNMGGGMPGFMGMMPGAMGMGMGGMGMDGSSAAGAGGQASLLSQAKAWKLFIGQISFDLTEEQLYPYFAQFGSILELALPRTDGRSRGYAFLTYSNQSEAQAAIEGGNGAVIPSDPRARPLTVRWADNKGR